MKTAETIWQARKKAPGLVLLPPHHALYREYSRKINAVYGTYTDLVELWKKLRPYEMNTLLVSEDMMGQLLKIPELHNSAAGMNFANSGKMITPFGATLLCARNMPFSGIIALDKRYALELVQCGDVSVEYDKLIDRQLERAAITSTAGFAKIFDGASKVLSV